MKKSNEANQLWRMSSWRWLDKEFRHCEGVSPKQSPTYSWGLLRRKNTRLAMTRCTLLHDRFFGGDDGHDDVGNYKTAIQSKETKYE